MISPCIKVCVLDPADRVCLGCGRTLAEIGGWSRFSDSEREAIMLTLPARRALKASRENTGRELLS